MPTASGLPTLSEATPFPGAPRYFRRDWDPPHPGQHGAVFTMPAMVIWGYSCRSLYHEDRGLEDQIWEARQAFPSACFSEACTDGEYGPTPLDEAQEITLEELQAALEKLGAAA